ncbi:hypothetical protein LDENG_00096810 [Lucifuga dentata]|nr:hypothetical protein LDENG_00096810 [Lucifuga dentata]
MLESLWEQGMQNCSTDENKLRIQQACMATGLVDERIKLWIYSRNRKKRKTDEGQSKQKKLCCSTSKASISSKGVTHNVAGNLKEDASEELGSEWNRQAQGEQSQASSSSDGEMDRVTADIPVQNSDKDSHQERVAHLIQCIEDKVQELQACSCDVIFMVYNHGSGCISTTGTMKGLDFLRSQDPGIHFQFAAAVSDPSCDYALN